MSVLDHFCSSPRNESPAQQTTQINVISIVNNSIRKGFGFHCAFLTNHDLSNFSFLYMIHIYLCVLVGILLKHAQRQTF